MVDVVCRQRIGAMRVPGFVHSLVQTDGDHRTLAGDSFHARMLMLAHCSCAGKEARISSEWRGRKLSSIRRRHPSDWL